MAVQELSQVLLILDSELLALQWILNRIDFVEVAPKVLVCNWLSDPLTVCDSTNWNTLLDFLPIASGNTRNNPRALVISESLSDESGWTVKDLTASLPLGLALALAVG